MRTHHSVEEADAAATPSEAIVELQTAKVIPDVVSHVSETADLSINYGGHTVSNRDQLALSQTAEEPEVVIDGSNTYTLVMVDPDAPSPEHPKYRFFLHWLVINIPALDVKRGEVVTPYMGPSPPKGMHRYVFLLYKQHGRVNASNPKSRANWTLHQFAQEHNLGDPAAAVFFYASPE